MHDAVTLWGFLCGLPARPLNTLYWDSFPQRHRSTAVSLSRYHGGNAELTYKQTIRNKVCTVTVDDCSTYECDQKRQLLRQKHLKEEDEECDEESKKTCHKSAASSCQWDSEWWSEYCMHIKTYRMAKHCVIFSCLFSELSFIKCICTKIWTWAVSLWLIFTQYKYKSWT